MKTYLIYGDNIPKIEERLNSLASSAKNKNWTIEYFDFTKGKSLAELLASTGLFSDKRIFIVDQIDKINSKDWLWLKANYERIKGYLVLIKRGSLNVKLAKSLPEKLTKEEYKLPKLIFKFCEAFYPENDKTAIALLNQLKNSTPPEFILAILARHLRDLYWLKLDQKPLPYKEAWRVERLSGQAKKFSQSQLTKIIGKLSDADILSKSSDNKTTDLLDQIVLTLLK